MSDPVARVIKLAATANAAGTATVTTDAVPSGYAWQLDYVVVSCSASSSTGVAALYESTADYAHFLDGAGAGPRAVAAYNPARVINAGESLVCQWRGLTAGDAVSLRVEYREGTVD